MKLPWQKKPEFFTREEKESLIEAIQSAERKTSGEIRLFVESHCRFLDPIDRAAEIFLQLEMDKTRERNATLVYIAVKDHQAAIVGDAGIHAKVGTEWWQGEIKKMMGYFRHHQLAEGICAVISDIGGALQYYFPYNADTDRNELPDEIVFGA